MQREICVLNRFYAHTSAEPRKSSEQQTQPNFATCGISRAVTQCGQRGLRTASGRVHCGRWWQTGLRILTARAGDSNGIRGIIDSFALLIFGWIPHRVGIAAGSIQADWQTAPGATRPAQHRGIMAHILDKRQAYLLFPGIFGSAIVACPPCASHRVAGCGQVTAENAER